MFLTKSFHNLQLCGIVTKLRIKQVFTLSLFHFCTIQCLFVVLEGSESFSGIRIILLLNRSYYNILVCCITIRYCGIIKYYNYYEYIPNSILSFMTIMIYIYNNTLIYSINYIRLDCLFKIYLYICGVSFRDTIMA